jgi:hypothetical protein
MAALDKTRLLKILGMTGSAHDGEALVALRKAQAIMTEAKATWADLVNGSGSAGGGSQGDAAWWKKQYQRVSDLANERAGEVSDLQAEVTRLRRENAQLRSNGAQGNGGAGGGARAGAGTYGQAMTDEQLHKAGMEALDDFPEVLTPWETAFLNDWRGKSVRWGMSDKQRDVFHRIWAKCDARVKGYG